MKEDLSISENELDGALNALFLETYSQSTDEELARFFLTQDYGVAIDAKKEKRMLAKLNGSQGGRTILLWSVAVLLITVSSVVVYDLVPENGNSGDQSSLISNIISNFPSENEKTVAPELSQEIPTPEKDQDPPNRSEVTNYEVHGTPDIDSFLIEPAVPPIPANEAEKEIPYFNKEGLNYFSKIKEKILEKFLKIDDLLYGKTAPGATRYRNEEVIVPPFVMSNFPVTNLQYKTFLADLVLQGRFEDMKKCLPKDEVWKEYGCNNLAKNYFSNEIYNDFPVVNIDAASAAMFCEWMQAEFNEELETKVKSSKSKGSKKSSAYTEKKKQVIVRLPYDYEWIYSVDAAYSLIPECSGYNTIYDPSEGLVDKGFYKRTSQVNKIDKSKETKMDKLADVNRFGMTEAEMIEIFKKAINYKNVTSKSSGNAADPANYPDNIEACCLAGHVCELINKKGGGMTVRGCCWQNKDEYLKMMETFNNRGASPFVGFRVIIMTAERGSDKNPFW